MSNIVKKITIFYFSLSQRLYFMLILILAQIIIVINLDNYNKFLFLL